MDHVCLTCTPSNLLDGINDEVEMYEVVWNLDSAKSTWPLRERIVRRTAQSVNTRRGQLVGTRSKSGGALLRLLGGRPGALRLPTKANFPAAYVSTRPHCRSFPCFLLNTAIGCRDQSLTRPVLLGSILVQFPSHKVLIGLPMDSGSLLTISTTCQGLA